MRVVSGPRKSRGIYNIHVRNIFVYPVNRFNSSLGSIMFTNLLLPVIMLQMTVRQMTVLSLCMVLLLAVTVDSRYLPTRGQEDRLDRLRDLLKDVSPSYSAYFTSFVEGGVESCVILTTSAKYRCTQF